MGSLCGVMVLYFGHSCCHLIPNRTHIFFFFSTYYHVFIVSFTISSMKVRHYIVFRSLFHSDLWKVFFSFFFFFYNSLLQDNVKYKSKDSLLLHYQTTYDPIGFPLWHQFIMIIIIIMSRSQHGYPWPSLSTSPYHSSPLAGLQGYISYHHIAAVCMFELVVLLLIGHMRGSTGVHHLRVRPCFSSSVRHVWFV